MKTKVRSTRGYAVAVMVLTAFSAGGCSKAASDPSHPNNVNADMLKPGTPNGVPAQLKIQLKPVDTVHMGTEVITIAARYVALKADASDTSVPTQEDAQTLMANMSAVWAQCNVKFILDEYLSPVAGDVNLQFNPPNQSDLDAMRLAYDDRKHALFVATGKWDRQGGDLGNDGSNGWSTVPTMSPQGTVVEAPVAKNTLLVSHEAGHLFGGLLHVTGSNELMNHFVSPQTTYLTQSECKDARAAVQKNNMAWIR